MIVTPIGWLSNASTAQLERAMWAQIDAGAQALLILAGERAQLTPIELNPLLQATAIPVFGGVFPSVFSGETSSDEGVIVVGFKHAPRVVDVANASGHGRGIDAQTLIDNATRAQSILIWADECQGQFSRLVEDIYDVFGGHPGYLGGVAGGLGLDSQHHSLFSNWGMLRDAALLVGFQQRIPIGLGHGFVPVAGPLVVSEADGNRIVSLDYRPVAEVYRGYVEALSGAPVPDDDAVTAFQEYPLGIERTDGSVVVRDPSRLENGGLVCAGDIPAQTTVRMLAGAPDSLLRAARKATREALMRASDMSGAQVPDVAGAFVVSCIGREKVLKHRYREELVAVRAELDHAGYTDTPVFGVLSLGEIANPGDRCLELLNKTIAVGLLLR